MRHAVRLNASNPNSSTRVLPEDESNEIVFCALKPWMRNACACSNYSFDKRSLQMNVQHYSRLEKTYEILTGSRAIKLRLTSDNALSTSTISLLF